MKPVVMALLVLTLFTACGADGPPVAPSGGNAVELRGTAWVGAVQEL